MERCSASLPLSDIVCVLLHINDIYGTCTKVINIYSLRCIQAVYVAVCTLKVDCCLCNHIKV